MENILSIYAQPYDDRRPLVCLDEFARQLLSNVADPLLPREATIGKQDYEYVREGFASAFMIALPHEGKREVFMSENATHNAYDFAHALEFLSDQVLPGADKIILVMDNLASHSEASLYKAFPAEKARRLCERFEMNYTPKHGSWLNMAEIEIGKINRSGLKQRIGSVEEMRKQIVPYISRENSTSKPIQWQFTTKDSRVKLKSLYPPF